MYCTVYDVYMKIVYVYVTHCFLLYIIEFVFCLYIIQVSFLVNYSISNYYDDDAPSLFLSINWKHDVLIEQRHMLAAELKSSI